MKHAKIKLSATPCLLGAMLLTVLPGVSAAKDDKADNKAVSNQAAVLPEMTVTAESEKAAMQTATEKYKLPAVTESVTREKMDDTINVLNTEDAIKYLPNILVRKRYIGDKEMPVSMRTSGTGSSARSLIYADGNSAVVLAGQ